MDLPLKSVVLAILVCYCGLHIAADPAPISFARYYGSHMVLHRAPRQAAVWGYTDMAFIGDQVLISLIDKDNQTVHMQQVPVLTVPMVQRGIWQAKLPSTPAGGPYTVLASLVTLDSAQLSDVYFGDVWLCSGQSNMEVSVDHTWNYTAEMAGASSYPQVRLYTVGRSWSEVAEDDVLNIFLNWTRPTSAVVGKFSSLCWSYGRKLHEHTGVPVGLVASSWGGTRIEAWSSADALDKCGPAPIVKQVNNKESMLWNAMIHPLLKMTITGVAWYQGEWNAREREGTYGCRFPAMIDDWRMQFRAVTDGQTDPEFPFGFVQLAAEKPDMTQIGGFPSLRWMQTAGTGSAPNKRMRNTFMAVAMDLPDFESRIGPNHPGDKSTISSRLLLGLRAVGLGEAGVTHQGPLPAAYRLDASSNALTLRLQHSPITIRNNTGFELCCARTIDVACTETDSHWKPATITGHSSDSVTLTADQCRSSRLLAHRYAWRTTPCPYKKCAIYSVENELPAPPYVKYGLLNADGQWHGIKFED